MVEMELATRLEVLSRTDLEQPLRVMNLCGGFSRFWAESPWQDRLAKVVRVMPGPGCPVCVCPEADIKAAIHLATEERVWLTSFGDMLSVPVDRGKGSLFKAKEQGGMVHPVASPMEAVQLAKQNPQEKVVFLASGFEPTAAPLAALLMDGAPDNFYILNALRLTWPAVDRLFSKGGSAPFDALIAPGNITAIIGSECWRFAVTEYGMPVSVSGFHDETFLLALESVIRQHIIGKPRLDIRAPERVRPKGNPYLQSCIDEVFEIGDAFWRGVGKVSESGYQLKGPWQRRDARNRFSSLKAFEQRPGDMPSDCMCAEIITAASFPEKCLRYGQDCTPMSPVGPCMASQDGACRVLWERQQGYY
uniref:Hydrogenase formation HypD protein n=1 Tax=Magnetococcus massalia (strain MO-1) TaxID=451514 RepID=A0A1S7LCD9_MAGMO|nr:Hydrogenase formation HypD protein [Candidatus Magnetococcus massalia]